MGKYYTFLLGKLDENVHKKPSLANKTNLVSSGKCASTLICFDDGKIIDLKYTLVDHLAYSPDLI